MLKMWENIGGDEVIAQLVERDQIPNFLKEAVVGPNEAMIYLRNGKIEDVLTQDKLKVEKQGIGGWFKSKIGGGDLVQLLYVSTGVIDLNIQIGKSVWKLDPSGKVQKNERGVPQWEVQGVLSKDHEEVKGTCTIRVRIDQNNAKKIFNLMRSAESLIAGKVEANSTWWGRNIMGRAYNANPSMVAGKFLFKSDLEDKVNNELLAKVLYPQLTAMDAKDLRGNLDFIKQTETATEVELRKSFELWGMNLVQFFTVFDRSASDALEAHKKKIMLVFEQAEFDKDIDLKTVINERNREYDVLRNNMEKQWAMKFGDQAGQDRFESMKLEAAIAREQMAIDHALAMKKKDHDLAMDMQKKEFDQAIEQKKRDGVTDAELQRMRDENKHAIEEKEAKLAMDMFQQVQENKRKRIEAEQAIARQGIATSDEQLREMNRQAHEFRMQLASPNTPSDRLPFISDALKQITEEIKQAQAEATKRQASAVGGDANVAFMNAEANKHNVDTYRQAEDRERQHQVNMTHQSANMMEASKQNVPQYVGGGYAQPQPSVNVVTVNQEEQTGRKDGSSGKKCPNCGEDAKASWKVCPNCQEPLANKSAKCPDCDEDVKPNWESCPGCGRWLE